MRRLFILLLLVACTHAEFIVEKVEVTFSDIGSDASVKVHESIKFIIKGEYEISVYDSLLTSNELSKWSTDTGLKELKFHVNPKLVDIRDLRLKPQPRKSCNPIAATCHGELILDYTAYPSYADSEETLQVPGTGLFNIVKYKPRTNRYSINPDALSFGDSSEGSTIIDKETYFIVDLPPGAVVYDANPLPADSTAKLPAPLSSLSWNDIVLVKFSLIFDVEEGIDKEVTGFFINIMKSISRLVTGPEGIPLIVLCVALVGLYLYITMAKKRGEE